MSELKIAALNVAATLHKSATEIVGAAEHFYRFLSGETSLPSSDAPAEGSKKRGRPAKGEAETPAAQGNAAPNTTSVASGAATGTTTTEAELKPVVTQPTLQQVADAVVALANDPKRGGRDAAVKILNTYGATKVPELKPESFQAVLDAVKALDAPQGAGGLV